MPDDVISCIHAITRKDPMGITFTDNGSTINIGDDYPSDDDCPEPHFGTTPNTDDKYTGSHDTKE